ncbi:c-type cytochrome [Pseudomarimonas salicorniae]|uniref:C-type cytochrome n=1 Tax=Pseudomarimonas salicorniae TaxID=2933270 RepID=A0ABT0GEN9_9GAMM|nr:c-type cytochrome [Lysobacter sp. CAU 1642]MCK7593016.1 c-type cytochrome [Lysobacter sp. CAU 1642]
MHPSSHPLRAGRCSALLAFGLLAASANVLAEDKAGAQPEPSERGRYLVNTAGCHDCHTPFKDGPNGPEPDMTRMLSGHPEGLVMPEAPVLPDGPWKMVAAGTNTAYSGGWGVSFTANLTPDLETGLGKWTVDDFKNTIRTGRHLGRGRPILPPMPIPVYNNFTDADLEAIYAYLRTIPPIRNRVPEPRPPAR